MSLKGFLSDYFFPWQKKTRTQSGDGDSSDIKVDFTNILLDKSQLLQEIGQRRVVQIKIFTEDLSCVYRNANNLVESLVDLRVRPRTQQIPADDSERCKTPERRSPAGVEQLHSELKSFVICLEQLVNLQQLTLDSDGTFDEGLFTSVSKLKKIKDLKLQNCGIARVDAQLPTLLTNVDLSSNHLDVFPQQLLQLRSLETLTLCKNCISELPDDIKCLKQLKKLDVSNNQLTSLPNGILEMKKLLKLYVTENNIKELPSNIGSLTTLRDLELRGNQINSLPYSIGGLHQLIKLNLCNNKLTALPNTICNLDIDDDALLFSGNPLQLPPAEVCMQGRDAMKGYFAAMEESRGVKCKRLKLILVGESYAGKTSLAHALVYKVDAKIKPDDRTVGLDVHRWRPNPQQENGIEICLIDCAGQRKYLLTHQFFFTEGAIFLLVLDLSKYKCNDDTYGVLVGDWISLIISHIPGAIIMIVPTHQDVCHSLGENVQDKCRDILHRARTEENTKLKLVEKEYKRSVTEGTNMERTWALDLLRKTRPKFASCLLNEALEDTDILLIPVCCKESLDGIDKLQKEILQIASNMTLCPIVNKEVPESWMELEEYLIELENSKNIPFFETDSLFHMVREKIGLNRQMFDSALVYLNAIGSIAYFSCVQKASHLVFINSEWLIDLLQLVFRHDHKQNLTFKEEYDIYPEQFEQDKELFINHGHLSKAMLHCIWHKVLGGLDVNLTSHIVGILEYFEIICELPRRRASDDIVYFIPWFVPEDRPEEVAKCWNQKQALCKEDNIIFQMTTSIACLPQSVFDRLLVYVHARSELCVAWKSGFLITGEQFKLLCNVEVGSPHSSVKLHGRCYKGRTDDLWKLILEIWKEFDILIREWSGIIMQRIYSVCPVCIEQCQAKPYIYQICSITRDDPNEGIPCQKCYSYNESRLLFPPEDILKEVMEGKVETDPSTILTSPLSDQELSIFAEKLGVEHTRLALEVGLKINDVKVAQQNHQNSQYEQALELLMKWKQTKGEADRSELINAANRLHLHSDVIRFLKFGEC